MTYRWIDIKKVIKITDHFIQRCYQRNITPKEVMDALRYGKKIYFIDKSELVTKYLDCNVGLVQRRDRLITAIALSGNKKECRRQFMKHKETFIFEEV